MRKLMFILLLLGLSVLFAQSCVEVWNTAPDPNGVDVACFTAPIGDDFVVASDTYICAIHTWISWQGDVVGTITSINASIYGHGTAEPNGLLWSHTFFPGDGITSIGTANLGNQWFYYPIGGTLLPADHNNYYELNLGDCDLAQYISDVTTPFHALSGTRYWLVLQITASGGDVGWKTSASDDGFDATFWNTGTTQFESVLIPAYDGSVHLAFSLCGCDDETCPVELSSFDAAVTQSNFVQLNWTTESENDLLGYFVLRSESDVLNEAIPINTEYILANNTTNQCDYVFTDTEVELNTTYNYWLESIEMNGSSDFFGPVSVIVEDDGGQTPPDPGEVLTVFYSVYPNPFNPNTKFSYSLTEAGDVSFKIYNTKGQLVKEITDHGNAGTNSVSWDASGQASGIYMIHMETANYSSMRKAILIK